LIAVAGGEVIFPELRNHSRAPDRVVTGDEMCNAALVVVGSQKKSAV